MLEIIWLHTFVCCLHTRDLYWEVFVQETFFFLINMFYLPFLRKYHYVSDAHLPAQYNYFFVPHFISFAWQKSCCLHRGTRPLQFQVHLFLSRNSTRVISYVIMLRQHHLRAWKRSDRIEERKKRLECEEAKLVGVPFYTRRSWQEIRACWKARAKARLFTEHYPQPDCDIFII